MPVWCTISTISSSCSIVKTHAIDQSAISRQAEHARFWVTRLWQRGYRTNLHKTEAQVGHLAHHFAVFVKACSKPNRVAELKTKNLAFQFGVLNIPHRP